MRSDVFGLNLSSGEADVKSLNHFHAVCFLLFSQSESPVWISKLQEKKSNKIRK